MIESCCKTCHSEDMPLKRKMFDALSSNGIDPQDFISSDKERRIKLITKGFGIEEFDFASRLNKVQEIGNTGVLIIKPEMTLSRDKILSYMTDHLNIQIEHTQQFIYSPEEYWQMHGRSLVENTAIFPHGVLLFLLSICEPSELVIFTHLSPDRYKKIFSEISSYLHEGIDIESENDSQKVFNDLFIRGNTSASIRSNICLPEVEKRGLIEMSPDKCPGTCWDISSAFSIRTREENIKTFNGVHSPRDEEELKKDLVVLSKIR